LDVTLYLRLDTSGLPTLTLDGTRLAPPTASGQRCRGWVGIGASAPRFLDVFTVGCAAAPVSGLLPVEKKGTTMIRPPVLRLVFALWPLTLACAAEAPSKLDAASGSTTSPRDTAPLDPADAGGDTQLVDTVLADIAPADDSRPAPIDVAPTADTVTVYSSCDQVTTAPFGFVAPEQIDALLARLKGAPCVGDLFCEAGDPQNCGTDSFNPYSVHAIGCTCAAGHFTCRDYRQEARDCGSLRPKHDGGGD
jgi:hypothetical protein